MDWEQLGQTITEISDEDGTGLSVAMSKNGLRLSVCSLQDDTNGEGSGSVRVFELDNNHWVQLGYAITGEAMNDNACASALSFDGSRIVIGSTGVDGDVPNSNIGNIRVFEWDNNSWNQIGQDI
jgi:hypothetical protein